MVVDCSIGKCRILQYITIRKQEEELHASVEAGLPDEEIGKLARISHRVSALELRFTCAPSLLHAARSGSLIDGECLRLGEISRVMLQTAQRYA